MQRPSIWKRIGGAIAGKGFYIVLLLCAVTVGLSGYYLVGAFRDTEGQIRQAGAETEVTLPDFSTPKAEPPVIQPTPRPKPQPAKPAQPAKQPESQPEAAQAEQQSSPVYTRPIRGEVIGNFSLEVLAYDETMGDWRTHSGVDLEAALGEKVQAVGSGEVTSVRRDALMGWTVSVTHPDGLVSTYCNLEADPPVEVGTQVVTGQVIGTVGDSAAAESAKPPHLHLEMSRDGQPVDPAAILPDA